MAKFQDHKYYMTIDGPLEGAVHIGLPNHVGVKSVMEILCGKDKKGLKAVKRLPDIATYALGLCPKCESKFRQHLAKPSALVDTWA